MHGYLREDGALCFIPESLKAHLASKDLAWTNALKRDLVSLGRLVRDRGQVTCLIRINGSRQRLYVLTTPTEDGVPHA